MKQAWCSWRSKAFLLLSARVCMESWLGSRETAPLFFGRRLLEKNRDVDERNRLYTTCIRVHGHRRMSITLGVCCRRRRHRRVIKPTPSPSPLASPFDPTSYPLPTKPRSIAVHVRSADRAIEQTLNNQTRSSVRGKFSSCVPRSTVCSCLVWIRRANGLVTAMRRPCKVNPLALE